MRGDGRYCFSPHTIDRIVIKTRHGALTEGIKNAQPTSMSGVRVRVGVMEIDLRNDVPPTFHIYTPGGDPFRIVNATENCLTENCLSIMAKRLLCPMSLLLKGLPPILPGGPQSKRGPFFHLNVRNYHLMIVEEMS
ncbi:hypothetical protein CDAR_476911 [Caerostris darwini]|uniref:Uncharacterized protein n=1 Tax=Caerostris darwini TaxID=1538125 RepID=A0AAV4U508_9ARAC|nr:hypothetical protein CDAR_476911 [Caerostris darwini]